MKAFFFIVLGLGLVALGVTVVKMGWFDAAITWFQNLVKGIKI